MELLDANQLSKKQYRELIQSLGGKYSFLERIRMGGTGIGGLFLMMEDQPELDLRHKQATETVRVSIELLKEGILIGLNNTKEVKLIPFRQPELNWEIIELPKKKRNMKQTARISLIIDNNQFILYTSGWNNEEVFRYLNRLKVRSSNFKST